MEITLKLLPVTLETETKRKNRRLKKQKQQKWQLQNLLRYAQTQ